MRFILGLLIGAGLAFTVLAIWAKEEQKTIDEYEKYEEWRSKLP